MGNTQSTSATAPKTNVIASHNEVVSPNHPRVQRDGLIGKPFNELWYHFKTFQTSRGLDILSPGCILTVVSGDDDRRWKTIVFNFNNARFPGGLIPDTFPKRHALNEVDEATGETLLVDLDFFENDDVLFEEHPFVEALQLDGFHYRKSLEAHKKPTWPVLVLMDQEQFKAWKSSASVEEIDAIDKETTSRGFEYPARHFQECSTPSPREKCSFCQDCLHCCNPNSEEPFGHCKQHWIRG